MEKDRGARLGNQELLRELAKDEGERIKIMCSHDPRELEHDSGRTLDTPAVAELAVPAAQGAPPPTQPI